MSRNFLRFIFSNFIRMLLLLFGVSVLTFILVISSPIDPVESYVGAESTVSQEQRENIAEYWGLNKSPVERYTIWITNILHGDMGESLTYRQPVTKIIGERFKTSLALMASAWVLSGILGFFLGVMSGTNKGGILDKIIKNFCLLMSSTPTFWFGLLMLIIFSVKLKWFPLGLAAPLGKLEEEVTFMDRIRHLILPSLTLSITGVANIALHTRQKLIDVLNSDYMLFAIARGESKWTAVRRHGIRNIAIPAVTLQFASFSELFGGSVLAEQVFSYPGLGNAATTAGLKGDVPLLLGIALFSAVFVFVGNLMANIFYGILNPEIRVGESLE
ncbi:MULTISPECIES: ABC transporter permease [Clostridium]|uniref:Dipeptide transport system permease protein DppB n=2 Tax=Clostridium TaxID=1485 RepID=A0A151ANE2_9CLOT|nr:MULTISPECIES: ABC transporter permease [Clostridium]KYH29143.1 dipeptide transport system permease protein DppB [Clostridium colicanis DSM 13634]MBE6043747.1 ABC transporter permease [Clostridium thermopalmarium]PRR73784.1 Dipeptide transport system permease protein DppB [Clostridium thermopalmarium DSM 5974]PVZ21163.1 peptide/nickel transport system permease protein [Clostridium thermopalmarium DSM 5974]